MAARLMLQLSDEQGSTDELDSGGDGSTLGLRIAAIFVILVSSLAGSFPPLFLRAFQRGSGNSIALLVRSFSAGVILALALVHILPEGFEQMDGLRVGDGYPIGGVTALFGLMLIAIIENVAHSVSRGRACAGHASGLATRRHDFDDTHSNDGSHDDHDTAAHTHVHMPAHGQVTATAVTVKQLQEEKTDAELVPTAMALGTPAEGKDGSDHSHGCMSSLRAATKRSWFKQPVAHITEVKEVRRYQVVALIMELGCAFHSVIIGVTLGANVEDISTLRALFIALVFHQALEGLSLGSVIARAGFAPIKAVGMVLLYSLTTPIGIAVGIAIASSYSEDSTTAQAVQGTLDCISGGLLLYIGLVQLLAEDFSREDLLAGSWKVRTGMYCMLFLGSAIMCVIAIWA